MTDITGLLIILIILAIINFGAIVVVFMFMMSSFDLLDITRPSKSAMQPTVTRTASEFVDENHALKEESSIVEPKSPQRIAFEEQEELRKMNITPR